MLSGGMGPCIFAVNSLLQSQVQGEREFLADVFLASTHRPRSVSELEKPRHAPALSFIGIHRKAIVMPAAWMDNVIRAAANGSSRPGIHNVEHQGRVNPDRRMQAAGRLAGA